MSHTSLSIENNQRYYNKLVTGYLDRLSKGEVINDNEVNNEANDNDKSNGENDMAKDDGERAIRLKLRVDALELARKISKN